MAAGRSYGGAHKVAAWRPHAPIVAALRRQRQSFHRVTPRNLGNLERHLTHIAPIHALKTSVGMQNTEILGLVFWVGRGSIEA